MFFLFFKDMTNHGCIYGLCLELISCGYQLHLIVQFIIFVPLEKNKQTRLCYKINKSCPFKW